MDKELLESCHKMLAVPQYSADDLAKLVKWSIEYYTRCAELARESARKTREEVKAEIINEYESENNELKKRLRYAVSVLNSDKELDRYHEFVSRHEKCMRSNRYNSGMIPYVKQVETGIGIATTVVCQICGETEDITDTSAW